MKKLSVVFAIIAAATAGLISCEEHVPPEGTLALTIHLDGVPTRVTRAIEPGARDEGIDVDVARSLIFVADADGTIVQTIDVAAAATDNPGQTLPNPVTATSKVYVVANIPAAQVNAFKALATLDAVKAATSTIESQKEGGYTDPAMANKSGEVSVSTATGNPAVLTVTIEPLFARVEIASMQARADAAGNTVTGFDVTGVWVDNYYDAFTYAGTGSGSVVSKGVTFATADAAKVASTLGAWASYMSDTAAVGVWTASGSPARVADPGAGSDPVNMWGYNVAPSDGFVAGDTPAIIVRLDDIHYTNAAGTALTLTGPRYLTVVGFTNGTKLDEVLRGDVYRLGGTTPFAFSFANLGAKPYEEASSMVVHVDVEQWNVIHYEPVFNND